MTSLTKRQMASIQGGDTVEAFCAGVGIGFMINPAAAVTPVGMAAGAFCAGYATGKVITS